jgi:hypothetical protein
MMAPHTPPPGSPWELMPRWLGRMLCDMGFHAWSGFETYTAAFRRCTRPCCKKRQFWFGGETGGEWKDVPDATD